MTKSNINTIIEEFIRKQLSPQPDEREFIEKKFEELCGFLKESYEAAFKNGSWARYTAIHPVSDLDVIWPLPASLLPLVLFAEVVKGKIDPNTLDVSNILKDIAKKIAEQYRLEGLSVVVEAQSHSVGIFFSPDKEGFSIDLVPAIPAGTNNDGKNMYYVPELLKMSRKNRVLKYAAVLEKNEKINWIKTDPRGYIKDSQKVNDLNEAYRKTSKFVKKWNYACKENNNNHILKSFHLELICRKIILANPSINTYEAIITFFKELENYLDIPTFKDRADQTRYVDAYIADLTEVQKAASVKNIAQVSIILGQLESASSEAEVHTLLNKILEGAKIQQNFYTSSPQRTVRPSGAWSM